MSQGEKPGQPNRSTIDRRRFLEYGALGGAAAVAGGALAPSAAGAAPQNATVAGATDDFELEELTLEALQERMSRGALTARSLSEAYLKRIEALDRQGPELRAVIEINPDALAIADAARRGAQGQGSARAAARHPDPAQGQHRHRRPDDDDGRLAGAGGLASPRRTPSSRSGCARRARCCSARPT